MALMMLAALLFFVGGLWLLVAMFRVNIWWGVFGILFPPVQCLFVLLNWGKSWRPLLMQMLALVLLAFALLNNTDIRIQEYWYQAKQQVTTLMPAAHSYNSSSESRAGAKPQRTHFTCDGRTHCSQMTSCAEAKFFLANCPDVQMDGNSDNEPCERQWCGG
jgi:hypothetical protein